MFRERICHWKTFFSSAVDWSTALQVGRSWVQFPMVSLEFFVDIILLAAFCRWGRNEYQEYFLGDKRGRCVGLTFLHVQCLEIWEPQPSGTLWACNGMALPSLLLLLLTTNEKLVFPTETLCIYCDVRTEHLYVIYRNLKPAFRLPGLLTSLSTPPVDDAIFKI
jgi:hypothetical protein